MSFCPKCGNKVDETMTFCPRCGASLKAEAPVQVAPATAPTRQRGEKAEKGEKQEKHEKQEPEKGEKGEKHEKGEFGFVGLLVGGLIMILIGFFALLRIYDYVPAGMDAAFVLLIIGVIIIIAAVYFTGMARKRYPPPA